MNIIVLFAVQLGVECVILLSLKLVFVDGPVRNIKVQFTKSSEDPKMSTIGCLNLQFTIFAKRIKVHPQDKPITRYNYHYCSLKSTVTN